MSAASKTSLSNPDKTMLTPPVVKEPKDNKMKHTDPKGRSYDFNPGPKSITVLDEFAQSWFAKVVHKTAEVDGEADSFEFIPPKTNQFSITFSKWIKSEVDGNPVLKIGFTYNKIWITDATDKMLAAKGLKPIARSEYREVDLFPDATTSFGLTPQDLVDQTKSPFRAQFIPFRD